MNLFSFVTALLEINDFCQNQVVTVREVCNFVSDILNTITEKISTVFTDVVNFTFHVPIAGPCAYEISKLSY